MRDIDTSLPPQTMRQWALRLHIPQSTLRHAVEEKRLAGYQFIQRGSIYIEAEEMARFLEASKVGGTGDE